MCIRVKSNLNSNVVVQYSDSNEGQVFERIYACLEACKSSFAKNYRPLISLDVYFLKGYFGRQLMAAVGRDGNSQTFPIAYVIVDVETKDSREWFIYLFFEELEKIKS